MSFSRRAVEGVTCALAALAALGVLPIACSLNTAGTEVSGPGTSAVSGSSGAAGGTGQGGSGSGSAGGLGGAGGSSSSVGGGGGSGGSGGAAGGGGEGGSGGGPVMCGNKAVELGEECDDGNMNVADGCSPGCKIDKPDTCPGVDIPLTAPGLTITGDLNGKGNDTSSTCGGSGSPDLVYAVTPTVSGTLTAELDGAFTKSLYVRRDCGSKAVTAELLCSQGDGKQSATLWVHAGVTYWVFADGKNNQQGAFTLTLTLAACGDGVVQGLEQCDDGNPITTDGCDRCLSCADSTEIWDPMTHHCYRVVSGGATWANARAACIAQGGDLAALSSTDEITLVGSEVDVDVWIGGNDLENEGDFTWSNGEPWTPESRAWSSGEPDDGGIVSSENCVQLIGSTNLYNDTSCNNSVPYVCERSPDGG